MIVVGPRCVLRDSIRAVSQPRYPSSPRPSTSNAAIQHDSITVSNGNKHEGAPSACGMSSEEEESDHERLEADSDDDGSCVNGGYC